MKYAEHDEQLCRGKIWYEGYTGTPGGSLLGSQQFQDCRKIGLWDLPMRFSTIAFNIAQCHKHPFDQWSKTDFDNFEKLFTAVDVNQNTMTSEGKKESGMIKRRMQINGSTEVMIFVAHSVRK
ncbi:MAG: hypothetical protein U0930_07295 [Pirellulales bacterium]